MKITPRKYAQALAMMLDTAEKTIISNFIAVLRERNQFKLLPKIMRAFEEEWLKRRGYTKIDVAYPAQFKESLLELEKHLKAKLGDKLSITATPSADLIGGFQVRIDDTLLDASVSGSLRRLAAQLQ